MKTVMRIGVLVVLSISVLWAQHPPNCNIGCGSGTPAPGTGGGPMLTTTSITNARGTGNSLAAAEGTGRSTAIEGSQSYTYAVNLFSLPGRNSLNLNLTLYYNSLAWEYNSDNNSMVYGAFDNPSPGFRLDYGLLQFASDLSLGVLTEPNGAKHLFVPTSTTNQFTTQDSSYILVQYPATSGNPAVVTYKNGLKVFFQLFDTAFQYQYRPYQIEDTNGNIIAIAYQDANSLRISTITDTVGRVIKFTYDSATGTMLQSVAQLYSSGQPFRSYSFGWAQNQVLTFNFTNSATAGLGLPPGNLTSGQSTVNLLRQVTRPDYTSVTFDYGYATGGNPDWGIVKSITEWSTNLSPRYQTSYVFPAANAGSLTDNPTYTQQIVNDGVNTGTWNFQATTKVGTLHSPAMVTCFAALDPLGRLNTTTFSHNGDDLDGLPVQQSVSTLASGTSFSGCQTAVSKTWLTTNQTWTTDASGNVLPASVTTVLEDGTTQSQMKFNSYDSFGQVTDVMQYDFGAGQPGPLLREAVTTYAALGNNIVTRPAEMKIKDGSGNLVSDTKFNYDEGSVASVSQPPTAGTHDEANYSYTSTNARGNLTSTISYANAAGATGAITSTFTHDEFGNTLVSSTGSGAQQKRTFSLTTQYAYPDSFSIGPSGSQLTTSFIYDMDRGVAKTVTDPNGQSSSATFDTASRLSTVTEADGITATTTYDDASANPSMSSSNTANSFVAKTTTDGSGHPLSTQMLNGNSLISTTAFTNDVAGQMQQATNPYGPSDPIVNTTYTYDPLGRMLTVTPPAIGSAAQNPYQTQYAPATFTDVFGFTKSGQSITTTDPAGKQRKEYFDVLGHIVRVDEPGPTGGQAGGSGSVSISGTEQSASVPNGGGATAGTGSVTVAGTDRSTSVLTHAATAGSGMVTISGTEESTTINCFHNRCTTIYDTGSVFLTVNGHQNSTTYGQNDTASTVASSLASAINGDSAASVTATVSGNVVTLIAKTTGASTNYSLSSGSVTNDPSDFSASFIPQNSGSVLSGGTDNAYSTMYDVGLVTVNVTISGTVYSKSSTYGQNSSGSSIASDLASQINADTTLNQKLVASSTSNVLNLTTTATGTNTADPLSVSAASSSPYFTSGSTSFTATPSGSTLTPGQNGVVYDAGTVTVSITGFTTTALHYTANYSQGSTANTVASAIASAINADPIAPVVAIVTTGSNVVTLTSKTMGSDTNYGVQAASATTQGTYFSSASFSGSPTSLTGGTDAVVSLTTPLITFAGYDAMGNLVAVSQGQQNRWYYYDSLGRMTKSCVPEMNNQCTTYTYTDFGAVATKIDPRGITTTAGYDAFNRLQTVQYTDGTPTVTYTYGAANAANYAAGRLTNVSSSVAAEAYTYDPMGRVTQCLKTIGGQNYSIGYHYSNGQLDYMTYPSGKIVYHDHDAIGRLSQIRSGGTTVFSIGSFNAAGEALSTTYGNGMTGAYTYNNQLQLASILVSSAGTPALNLAYSYGGASNNGQISGITDGITAAQSTSYVYDELGRLKVAQTNDLTSANTWKLKFSYDRYGNRSSQIPAAGAGSMPLSEVAVDPNTNRLTNLVYDADGNVVNDNQHIYTYDGLNQITSVDGTNNTYAYDSNGLRVKKNGTIYIYDGGLPIAEYAVGTAANSPSVEYGYVGGRLFVSLASGVSTYYYSDHLSTRIQADGSGTVNRTFGHYPFGETWYETGSASKWKFTTYERDMESGLDYASARFHASQFGRFTSLDPLSGILGNPQSLNRYVYVMNDPINLMDPTGAWVGDPTVMCMAGDGPDMAHGCARLDGESEEMKEGEALFDVQVYASLLMNRFGTDAVGFVIGPDGDPLIAKAIQQLGTPVDVAIITGAGTGGGLSGVPVVMSFMQSDDKPEGEFLHTGPGIPCVFGAICWRVSGDMIKYHCFDPECQLESWMVDFVRQGLGPLNPKYFSSFRFPRSPKKVDQPATASYSTSDDTPMFNIDIAKTMSSIFYRGLRDAKILGCGGLRVASKGGVILGAEEGVIGIVGHLVIDFIVIDPIIDAVCD